jgi:hypothetical protein
MARALRKKWLLFNQSLPEKQPYGCDGPHVYPNQTGMPILPHIPSRSAFPADCCPIAACRLFSDCLEARTFNRQTRLWKNWNRGSGATFPAENVQFYTAKSPQLWSPANKLLSLIPVCLDPRVKRLRTWLWSSIRCSRNQRRRGESVSPQGRKIELGFDASIGCDERHRLRRNQ